MLDKENQVLLSYTLGHIPFDLYEAQILSPRGGLGQESAMNRAVIPML